MSSEKSYVILEFANENILDGDDKTTPVQVGYSEWLIFDDKGSETPIKDVILSKTLVRSKWPSNYNVQPRRTMSRIKDVVWKEVVAYVRGHTSKWEDAVQGSKHFIDTGVCFPTLKERKEFARMKKQEADDQYFLPISELTESQKSKVKQMGSSLTSTIQSAHTSSILTEIKQQNVKDDDNNDDSTSTNSYGSFPLQCTESKAKKSEHIFTSRRKSSKKRSAFVSSSRETSESDEEEKPNIKRKSKKRKNKVSKKKYMKRNSSQSIRSSNESEVNTSSENEDLHFQNMQLKKKIKSLTAEVETYKAMKSMIAEFTSLPRYVKKIQEKLKECLKDNPKSIAKTIPTSVPNTSFTNPSSRWNDPASRWDDDNFANRLTPVPSTSTVDLDIDVSSAPKQEHLKDISNISIAKCYTNLPANDNTSPSTEEIVRFGSRSVPKSMIDKLRHGKIGLLTNGLTEAVFTPEEIALSTVRGSKTNAHKGVLQKKTLDQSLVQAIIEYCATSFNKSTSEVSSEVIKSIGFKLNNFTKTEEGKKIIKKHKLSLGLSID